VDVGLRLLIAGGIMGVLDFVWLGFVAKKLYEKELGGLLLDKPNMAAALAFYVLYVVGVVLFVVNPAVDAASWRHALGSGALFGLVAYATYDLTNLATIKGFSSKIVAIDLIWGAFITSVVAAGTYALVSQL
jgi:uncharacterized membrane protein